LLPVRVRARVCVRIWSAWVESGRVKKRVEKKTRLALDHRHPLHHLELPPQESRLLPPPRLVRSRGHESDDGGLDGLDGALARHGPDGDDDGSGGTAREAEPPPEPTPEERTAQQFAKEQARQQQSAEKVKVGVTTEGR
jgi:hypothetical protein